MNTSSASGISKGSHANRTALGAAFWFKWVAATAAASLVALAIAAEFPWGVGVFPSGDPANTDGYRVAWAVALGGLLAGACLGGAQWLILRGRYFADSSASRSSGVWWLSASTLGFGASFTLAWAVGGGFSGAGFAYHGLPHAVDRAGILGGILIGATVSVTQSIVLLLRGRRSFRVVSLWWAPVNTAAFVISWAIAAAMSAPAEPLLGPMTHFWGAAAFGLFFAISSTAGLAWVSRSAVPARSAAST